MGWAGFGSRGEGREGGVGGYVHCAIIIVRSSILLCTQQQDSTESVPPRLDLYYYYDGTHLWKEFSIQWNTGKIQFSTARGRRKTAAG